MGTHGGLKLQGSDPGPARGGKGGGTCLPRPSGRWVRGRIPGLRGPEASLRRGAGAVPLEWKEVSAVEDEVAGRVREAAVPATEVWRRAVAGQSVKFKGACRRVRCCTTASETTKLSARLRHLVNLRPGRGRGWL